MSVIYAQINSWIKLWFIQGLSQRSLTMRKITRPFDSAQASREQDIPVENILEYDF